MSTETWKSKPDDEKLIGTMIGPNKDIEVLGIAYRDTTTYSYVDFTVFNVRCTKCGREYTVPRHGIHKAVCRICGNSSKYNYDKPGYLEEIVGNKYGKLTVIGFDHFKEIKAKNRNNPQRKAIYKCQCDCGNITYVERIDLMRENVKSCGCTNRRSENKHVGSLKGKLDDPEYLNEIVGKKYNMLTVVKFDHIKIGNIPKGRNTPRKEAYYLCRCDCGKEKVLEKNKLISGQILSCGCANYIGVVKHGESRTRLYHEWQGMKTRCYNPNTPRWKDYGGRGITVCPEWLGPTTEKAYETFKKWALENGYTDELSIDRIDNDGPYAPWNCRWITLEEQNWNKRNNTVIKSLSKEFNIKELYQSENTPLSMTTIQHRFSNDSYGNFSCWSVNDKLFIPPDYGREKYRKDHDIKDVFIFDNDSPYKL